MSEVPPPYPWLCAGCRATVALCGAAVLEGEDTDDPEAPCTLAYDLRLFCGPGGLACGDPPAEWVRDEASRLAGAGELFQCPDCGGLSAFLHHHAERLRVPLVRERPGHDLGCGHCGAAYFAAELRRREEARRRPRTPAPARPAAACTV